MSIQENTASNKPALSEKDQALADNIAMIMEQMNAVSSIRTPRLSERLFANVFIPLFAGDETLPYPVTLNHWLNVAGNPYTPVTIVADNGEELFVVPPLLDREAVNPVVPEGEVRSISHVVKSAKQYSDWMPKEGARYLDNELAKRSLLMHTSKNALASAEAWNAIFARYQRPPLVDLTGKKKDEASTTDNSTAYEDFEPL